MNYLRHGELLCPDDKILRNELLIEASFYQVQGIISQLQDPLTKLSRIIKNGDHGSTVMSWLPSVASCTLIFRASSDGKTAGDFHRCCDNKGPTLIVIQSEENILGGYTSKSWTSRKCLIKYILVLRWIVYFTENISIEPTAVTTWRKHCTVVADKWEQWIENNYKITRDNKLRQFYFKLLHRILVTNKELTRFGITDCTMCVMCGENDSIEHTFFECRSFLKLCDESLQWFNISHKTNIKPTPLQVFLNLPTPAFNLSNKQTKDLCLLLLYVKQYHYGCKSMQKKTDTSEFISKFIMQLEIEVWHDSATLLSALYVY